ncbi:hypothetical protein HMPREF2141_00097 [Bacteroides uniformis]|nr:hypothetical protein HMPREF2141_00097 [Bacteroides uniformis]
MGLNRPYFLFFYFLSVAKVHKSFETVRFNGCFLYLCNAKNRFLL